MLPFSQGQDQEFTVGSDHVVVSGGTVTIHAAREMADWQVREFCLIPIRFRGRQFFLRRKCRVNGPRRFVYELSPWPEELREESSLKITYDELYVALRDEAFHHERRSELGRLLLLPAYPLLGFCWSRFKAHSLERFGINSVSVTEGSLALSFGFFMLEAIFILYLGHGYGQLVFGLSRPWLDWAALVLLPMDIVVRYSQVLRDEENPDGFLEWLWRRRA